MAMSVTANVPLSYQWDNIDASLKHALGQRQIKPSSHLSVHYAWLLQITSWTYGINWNPLESTITVEIPFSGVLSTMDTAHDKNDYDRIIAMDEISLLLQKCMEKVPLVRLLAHFQTQD